VNVTSRLRAGLVGLLALLVTGTVGYIVIEGASPIDSFYMVAITITTVGFGEVFELSGGGRAWTVLIMVFGLGLFFYTAGAGIEQLFVYGASRRRARAIRVIEQMSDHVILCGFGRVGRGVLESLQRRDVDVVVVERDIEAVEQAELAGAVGVLGDATHNEVLLEAGIERARALVSCVTEDANNLVIVLSARSIRDDLHIVSRASESEWDDKLRLAGADRVVTPQKVGSERLAAMAVERSVAEMFDVVVGGRALEFAVEELKVSADSPVVGSTIRDSAIREQSGALILAVEDQRSGTMHAPSPDHLLRGHETVIVVGSHDQVEAAARILEG
jgi:voltage-gated potassium channel